MWLGGPAQEADAAWLWGLCRSHCLSEPQFPDLSRTRVTELSSSQHPHCACSLLCETRTVRRSDEARRAPSGRPCPLPAAPRRLHPLAFPVPAGHPLTLHPGWWGAGAIRAEHGVKQSSRPCVQSSTCPRLPCQPPNPEHPPRRGYIPPLKRKKQRQRGEKTTHLHTPNPQEDCSPAPPPRPSPQGGQQAPRTPSKSQAHCLGLQAGQREDWGGNRTQQAGATML